MSTALSEPRGQTRLKVEQRWINKPTARRQHGVSDRTLDNLIRQKLVRVRKLPGAHPLIWEPSLVAFLEAHTYGPEEGEVQAEAR
jgi:hypothetical protein